MLAYKKKRNIVNRAYQTQPDNIVGKMTILALDGEQAKLEGAPPAPGLTMAALASKDKVQSLQWATAAIGALTATRAFLASPPPGPLPGVPPLVPPPVQLTFDVLETHFHFSTLVGSKITFVDAILGNFKKAVGVLNNSGTLFVDDTTSAEAAKGTPASAPASPTSDRWSRPSRPASRARTG